MYMSQIKIEDFCRKKNVVGGCLVVWTAKMEYQSVNLQKRKTRERDLEKSIIHNSSFLGNHTTWWKSFFLSSFSSSKTIFFLGCCWWKRWKRFCRMFQCTENSVKNREKLEKLAKSLALASRHCTSQNALKRNSKVCWKVATELIKENGWKIKLVLPFRFQLPQAVDFVSCHSKLENRDKWSFKFQSF